MSDMLIVTVDAIEVIEVSTSPRGEKGEPGDLTPELIAAKDAADASAATATTQAGIATSKAGEAAASAESALSSKTSLSSALVAFQSIFLGRFDADPTVDGNGNALVDGAEYYNNISDKTRVYSGGVWADYDASAQTATTNAALSASSAASSAGMALLSESNAAASAASVVRDGSGGVAGLTLFKVNLWNALGTIKSFFTNANTAARTYTFQDRDGTIADDTDLDLKISRDGTAPPTANLPMGGFRHTNVADGLVATDYASYGQLMTKANLAGSTTQAFSASTFTGAGTGLTGTAAGLNIGGNAATATNVTSGKYTPTLTLGTNVATALAYSVSYIRVGNVVTVMARFDMSVTTANTNTTIYISLPIASNITGGGSLVGNVTNVTVGVSASGTIGPDAINDSALLQVYPSDTANRGYCGQFMYIIL